MRFIYIIGLLFFGINLFAQETHTFKYRLDYQLEGVNSEESSYFKGQHYIPGKFTKQSKNSLAFFPFFSFSVGNEFVFIDGNTAVTIQNKDLDNNFEISQPQYYDYKDAVKVLYDEAVLKKTDREPLNIMDKSCTQYQLFVREINDETEKDVDLVLCIDETSEIDNLSFLIQQKSNPIKGLILAVGPSNLDTNERIVLNKITPINTTIHFDAEKEIALYQTRKDSLEQIYNYNYDNSYDDESTVDSAYAVEPLADYSYYNEYMAQPKFCDYVGIYDLKFEGENSSSVASSYLSNVCSPSYYMKRGDEEKYKKFALKEIKSLKKNYVKSGLMPKKDAEMFYEFLKKDILALKESVPIALTPVETIISTESGTTVPPPVAYYEENDVYVWNYESSYKNLTPESSDYAIDNLESNSVYWKGIPAYCSKIDSIIPEFSDKELAKHAKNYAGQICDMYLGEFEGSSVWYKGTIDAIRSEQLYFQNNTEKLSKKDKKLLSEFLNKLD